MIPHAIARLILLKFMEYSKLYLLLSGHQLEPKLVVYCYLVYDSVFSKADVWEEGLPTSEGMTVVATIFLLVMMFQAYWQVYCPKKSAFSSPDV